VGAAAGVGVLGASTTTSATGAAAAGAGASTAGAGASTGGAATSTGEAAAKLETDAAFGCVVPSTVTEAPHCLQRSETFLPEIRCVKIFSETES
jgi:hypothetical protein